MLKETWKNEISIWDFDVVILFNLNEIFLFRIICKFLLKLNFKDKKYKFIRIKKFQSLNKKYLNVDLYH